MFGFTSPSLATIILAALLALTGIAGAQKREMPPYVDGDYAFILTSDYDYAVGSFSLMDLNAPWDHLNSIRPMNADSKAFYFGGLIYVVNGWGGDNIEVLDPENEFGTVLQFSIGAGSNPQHICFVDPERAFVTRYERTELWEVNPATGEHTDTIDLAPLADADGIPEMHMMAIYGDRLYVTIQRLDRDYFWLPEGTSYLAVIDLATNTLLDMDPGLPGMQGIALAATNPNSGIRQDPRSRDFLIGLAGTYGETDGGIERFDPVTQTSAGLVVTGAALGGDLHCWDTGNGEISFGVVIATDWSTRIVRFSLTTGENLGTLATSTEYAYQHLVVDMPNHQLLVADRTYALPGIRIFDTSTLTCLTPTPLDVGLYPHWILPMHGSASHVEPPELGAIVRAWPCPAAGPIDLQLQLPAAGPVEVAIYDLLGRPIARIFAGPAPGGSLQLRWDGRDDRGAPVQAGVYFAAVRQGSLRIVRRLEVVR